jgi:hypothetical protein
MANKKSTPITASIATILPREEIETLARELGVVTRQRKVQVFALVTVLTMAYRSGTTRTIAAMRETYEKLTNTPLTRNAFYKRFTKALAGLLRRLVFRVLEQQAKGGRSIAGGALSQFRDLVIVDSTVLRLKDRLSKTFSACWTSHTKAAAKLHMVYGVGSARLSQVKLTAERVSDQTPWRKIGDWVRGSLVAFDLGYCNYQLFDRIEQHGGWFVTRLKRNVHATIVSENRPCRGASRTMLGQRLKEVLPGLRRGVLDGDLAESRAIPHSDSIPSRRGGDLSTSRVSRPTSLCETDVPYSGSPEPKDAGLPHVPDERAGIGPDRGGGGAVIWLAMAGGAALQGSQASRATGPTSERETGSGGVLHLGLGVGAVVERSTISPGPGRDLSPPAHAPAAMGCGTVTVLV